MQFPTMLPHALLAYYYYKDRNIKFNQIYMGTDGNQSNVRKALEGNWTSVGEVGGPRLRDHPMMQNLQWRTTDIPMALHGDAMPMIKVGKAGTKSFDATSISPLMAIGHTKIIKQCVFGLFEKVQSGNKQGQLSEPANHW